jgi:hypothetical protein
LKNVFETANIEFSVVLMFRAVTAFLIVLLAISLSFAKDKEKKVKLPLPADVLQAQTVVVVIDPDAGEPVTDPEANARAREDVENAITKWNRFQFVPDGAESDLVITVRRGTGKNVNPTVKGGQIDQRPVVFAPSDGGVRIGGHEGASPNTDPRGRQPQTGMEYGPADEHDGSVSRREGRK